MRLTEADIEAGKTPKGGFTKAQLAKWGVPWPPPKGWRKALCKAPEPKQQPKGRVTLVRVEKVLSVQKAIPGYTDVAEEPSMIDRYVYQVG